MKRTLLVIAAILALTPAANAAINYGGDVSPATNPSTWTTADKAYVGYNTGMGHVTVDSGDDVTSYRIYLGYDDVADGSYVTVSGTGSTWTTSSTIYAGYYGNGTLNVLNGATVNPAKMYINYRSNDFYSSDKGNSTGTVNVDGDGSLLTMAGDNYIGSADSGYMYVTNGGAVVNSNALISADYFGSTAAVEVTGAGSTWTNNGYLYVSSYGTGSLTIADGGTVSCTVAKVGASQNSIGNLTISGATSAWTVSNFLQVGQFGNGTVTQNGGTVTVGTTTTLGVQVEGTGTYNLNGGTLIAGGDIALGAGSGNYNLGGGTLKAVADLAVSAPVTLAGNGTIDTQEFTVGLTGTVSGANRFAKAGTGSLVLGSSAQAAVLTGGGVDVQAGSIAFDYDGVTTPAAAVQSALATSYNAGGWDTGQIQCLTKTGSHGLGWRDNATDTVSVKYTYYGDSDLDGDVDNSDFLSVYGNFTGPGGGNTEIWATGDFDYDGDVDNSDFLSVYGNFTGPLTGVTMAALSANIDIADLIYDPATGNVKLDASEAAGGVITGFVLQNAAGGEDFITGVVDFPYLVGSETDLATEISDVDLMKTGFSGVYDLGNIFVTGLDAASLAEYLTKANYVGSYGSGEFSFDLTIVPEPSSVVLLAAGLFGLLAYAWRKRK